MTKLAADSFHLLSFSCDGQTVEFFSEPVGDPGPKVTIVIGPNGSGKSRILATLVDELVTINELLHPRTVRGPKASSTRRTTARTAMVEYALGETLYKIERFDSHVVTYANGRKIKPSDLLYPRRAIAVAHLPVDKFRFSRDSSDEFYVYLGLRQATNLTTTGALELKVLTSLLHGQADATFAVELAEWLALIGLRSPPRLKMSLADRSLLDCETFDQFVLQVTRLARRRVGSARLVDDEQYWQRHSHEIDALWMLISHLRARFNSEAKPTFETHLVDGAYNDEISAQHWEKAIEGGRRLRLISELALSFKKQDTLQYVNFSNLSSGEQQILGTISRLLGSIAQNSIVVIDEPEVSLHPEWQLRYVPMLLRTLKDRPSTHVLIATHSHFLVSDVNTNHASLVVPGQRFGTFEQFKGDVYGRSPENILYRVFGVSASGNFYVERDLAKALRMISRQDELDAGALGTILNRLEKVAGEDNEALRVIVDESNRLLEESRK